MEVLTGTWKANLDAARELVQKADFSTFTSKLISISVYYSKTGTLPTGETRCCFYSRPSDSGGSEEF